MDQILNMNDNNDRDGDQNPIIPDGEEDQNAMNEEFRPPRPANAFMLFGKDYRKVLANRFPDLSNKQISKILGDEWRKMDYNLKTYYLNLADERHRQHLLQYPGYYYSPLEARQRKAERKRRNLSKTLPKAKRVPQPIGPAIQPFGGNSLLAFPRPLHPTLRPIFGIPFVPRMRFVQPMVPFGPNHPFGGFMRPANMMFYRPQTPGMPISAEHSYAALPKEGLSAQQEVNSDPNNVESNENTDNEVNESTNFEQLSHFLPPMHNPNIEVKRVLENNDHSMDQLNESDAEVTKMANAMIVDEVDSTEEECVPQSISEVKKSLHLSSDSSRDSLDSSD